MRMCLMRFLAILLCGAASSALAEGVTQSVPVPAQTIAPSDSVTTTLQSPTGTTTVETPANMTTRIVTVPAKSVVTKARNGSVIEIDSDASVYEVFPDGARTAAPDGVIMLQDGTAVAVKGGKRIP